MFLVDSMRLRVEMMNFEVEGRHSSFQHSEAENILGTIVVLSVHMLVI